MRTCQLLISVGLLALPGCKDRSDAPIASRSVGLEQHSREPIQPLVRPPIDTKQARLGRKLFFETKLSRDGSVACVSCHDPSSGGDDGKAVSIGVNGQKGEINAPTVLNASLNAAQFWDGRASSLHTQIDGPLLSPLEMASSWAATLEFVKQDPEYPQMFDAAFPDGVTRANIRSAIVEYQRHLTCAGSRFDRFLAGDLDAITPLEKNGYELFKNLGCSACHQGANVGGNMFQRIGLFGDYIADRGNETRADLGRFNVTGLDDDRYVFKVPSLRHVSDTAPYFHDGQTPSLAQAIRLMAKYQLGRSLSAADVEALVAFLGTLPGSVPPMGPANQ